MKKNPEQSTEDLAVWLGAPNSRAMLALVGPEKGRPTKNGIARFDAEHGSTRYVAYQSGQAIGVLQVVRLGSGRAKASNAFIVPDYRRQGVASRLLGQARSDFIEVLPADENDLSGDGAAWTRSQWKANPDAPARIPNPYLDAYHKTPLTKMWEVRRHLTAQYAWAIPTDEAVRAIASLSPVVEMGAGTGYWASLIAQAGGQIRCFDRFPPGEENQYRHRHAYVPIERGGPEVLGDFSAYTLMLCWPPYDDPMAAECLDRWRGNRLVYIGEGPWGCTADDAFFERLGRGFELEKRIEIPQWEGIHDDVTIYRRR